jgi:hypothetical protein
MVFQGYLYVCMFVWDLLYSWFHRYLSCLASKHLGVPGEGYSRGTPCTLNLLYNVINPISLFSILLQWQPETFSSNERGRFGALKSDSTHHYFKNACTKSGSLRFSQFSGCWLILSVYILMSFDFPFVRLFGVR